MTNHLLLMGEPRLVGPHGTLVRLPSKAFGLAAAIALTRSQVVNRSAMAELLWGSTERRHGNLRKLLWATRTAVQSAGIDLFVSDNATIRLSTADITVDVIQLHKFADDATFVEIERLCNLYRGDLLDGGPIDSPEFSEWVDVQRAKLRDTFLNAVAQRLGGGSGAAGTARDKAVARRLLEIDPYNEAACRRLMEIQAAQGETAQIQDTYRTMSARLAGDLSAVPALATTSLFLDLTAQAGEIAAGAGPPPQAAGVSWISMASRPVSPRPASGIPTIVVSTPHRAQAPGARAIADLFVDDLATALCRCKTLSLLVPEVAASRGAGREGGDPASGADYVVDCNVACLEDGIRLTLRLVHTADRTVIWVDQVDILADHAGARLEAATAATAVGVMARIERAELEGVSPERSLTAFQWYLLGCESLKTMELPSIRRGRRALKAAREAHPSFAPAIGALARSYGTEWLLLARTEQDMLAEALRLGSQAIRIDPDDSAGYRAAGFAQLYQRSHAVSLDAYGRADRLNPHCPDILSEHAIALAYVGALEPARRKIEEAFGLNRVPPDYYHWALTCIRYLSGDSAGAIAAAQSVQSPSIVYRLLACCYAQLGEPGRARHYVAKVMEMHPDFSIDRWMSLVPICDPRLLGLYIDGLRLAGFV